MRAEQYYRDGLSGCAPTISRRTFSKLISGCAFPPRCGLRKRSRYSKPHSAASRITLGPSMDWGSSPRQGQIETAISLFERALAQQPHSVPTRRNMATALAQSGQRQAAERELHRALEDDPSAALTYCTLAQVLAQDEAPGRGRTCRPHGSSSGSQICSRRETAGADRVGLAAQRGWG